MAVLYSVSTARNEPEVHVEMLLSNKAFCFDDHIAAHPEGMAMASLCTAAYGFLKEHDSKSKTTLNVAPFCFTCGTNIEAR